MLAVTKAIFIILLLGAGILLGGSRPFSTVVNRGLHAFWRSYTRHHIQADGRVSLGARLSPCLVRVPRPLQAYFPCF